MLPSPMVGPLTPLAKRVSFRRPGLATFYEYAPNGNGGTALFAMGLKPSRRAWRLTGRAHLYGPTMGAWEISYAVRHERHAPTHRLPPVGVLRLGNPPFFPLSAGDSEGSKGGQTGVWEHRSAPRELSRVCQNANLVFDPFIDGGRQSFRETDGRKDRVLRVVCPRIGVGDGSFGSGI